MGLSVTLAVVASVSYLLFPLAEDNGVHFAGVHQAQVSGRGLFEVWNFRGPSYNAYLFLLYRLATTFVDFFDWRFDVIVRSVHLAVIVGGCAVWARGLSVRFALSPKEALVAAALTLFAMTSCWQTIPLHAEDVTSTALLYAMGMAMLPQRGWHVLAGLLPFVKGITSLMILPVLLAGFAAGGKRRLFWLLAMSCGATLVNLALLRILAPIQLRDLLETLHYQGGEWSIPARLVHIPRALNYPVRTPVLLPAAIALVLHALVLIQRRAFRELLFVGGLWLVPTGALLLQGAYFSYHFSPIVLGASYSLGAVLVWARDKTERRNFLTIHRMGIHAIWPSYAQHPHSPRTALFERQPPLTPRRHPV